MPPPPSPRPRPRRTPSLTSLTSLATNPPPITLWPTIFPPSGALTPLLTSSNPREKIQALSTVIALLTHSKMFIIAASNTPSSTTAFTTPAAIALSTVRTLAELLPALLNEKHPIALAKTARLAAELSSCGIKTTEVARKLYNIVLDENIDRTSRAAAASALASSVCEGDTDLVCNSFSTFLSNQNVPVTEMLAVLRAAVIDAPTRFVAIWRNASDVLIYVLNAPAVGLHAVRLVQGFVSALLEKGNHHVAGHGLCRDGESGLIEESIDELLPAVYTSILAPAATSNDQPMQLSATAAIDAFQQLNLTTTHHDFANILTNVRILLRRLSVDAAIPVRSAALKALGNHPVHFDAILIFLVTTPSKPTLPLAKAFSAAAVLLEKMAINEHILEVVQGFMQAAVDHISVSDREMSKAERTSDESLRVACLAFLGVALARGGQLGKEEMNAGGMEEAVGAIKKSATGGSVNVRVHACKSFARVLKDWTRYDQRNVADFLCSLLVPSAPVRVMMASARALVGMKDLSIFQSGQKVLLVERCVRCSKAREGIGDTRTRALRQALRRLLGELVVRIVEEGLDWRSGSVAVVDLYDCIAAYYRLPGFLRHRFEEGDEKVLAEFPEEARRTIENLLHMRHFLAFVETNL